MRELFGASNTKLFISKEINIMKKKILTLLPILCIPLAMSLTACGNKTKIGILQFDEFDALDAARKGFEDGLKQGGFKNFAIDYKNGGGQDADLQLYAKDLVDTCALTLGIATPAAKALKGASDNAGYEKPVLYTAVTDPVDAGLISSKDNSSGYICGTSDANPVEEQIGLVKEFKPSAQKVGILYTQKETNSEVQAKQAKAAIEKAGMTAVVKTCLNESDIKTTAEDLMSQSIDAIYLPTDNNIAKNINSVKEAASSKQVLIVCGEEGMLKNGGHVTLSIDYYSLGVTTGKMAAQILNNEKKPTDFPDQPVAAKDCSYVYSSVNLASAGLTMPEAMLSAHNWKDIIA